ncbi:MAG: hypothetical protein KDB14_27000 [Planctomycetales bacterium]|nr:hypothetical protein [Planctomycetales bacterium]
MQLPAVIDHPPLTRMQRRETQRWYDQAVQFAARAQTGGEPDAREAMRRLQACLERDPGNSLFIELTLRNAGQLSRREPSWLSRKLWLRRVRLGAAKGDWLDVQRCCLDAIHQWRGELELHALRHWAMCCAAFDQLPGALVLLQHADAIAKSPDTLALAVQALTRLGRFEDADRVRRELAALAPEHESGAALTAPKSSCDSPAAAEMPLPDDASDVEGMLRAARDRANRGRWTDAQRVLQLAMSASPAHPGLVFAWEELQLEHVRHQRDHAQQSEMSPELLAELDELVYRIELEVYDARGTRLPDQPRWRVLAAELLLAEGRAEAAQRQLSPLPPVEICPAAHVRWAESEQLQHRFDAALDSYKVAIGATPASDPVGSAARRQGARLAEAMGQAELAARWRAELESL